MKYSEDTQEGKTRYFTRPHT